MAILISAVNNNTLLSSEKRDNNFQKEKKKKKNSRIAYAYILTNANSLVKILRRHFIPT